MRSSDTHRAAKPKKSPARKSTPQAPKSVPTGDLADIMDREQWRQRHGLSVFPTEASMVWFLRLNRRRLIQKGMLFPRQGRLASLVHARLADEVRAILVEDAQERIGEAA